jgi:hypothetical protein
LARRLGYAAHPVQLQRDLEQQTGIVLEHMQRLEQYLQRKPPAGPARSPRDDSPDQG